MTQPNATPTRRTRRRSPLPALALTVLVAAGAVAGATAVFSSRAQTLTRDLTDRLVSGVNASGVARVENPVYRRGFAGSTQTITVVVQPDAADPPVVLLVTNHIQHGPFPGLRGVGQAVVDTDIRFSDPQVQAQVDRAFGGQKPTIHTVVGLGGSADTRIEVPAGRVTQDGDTVTWQALTANVRVDGLNTVSNLTWPGLTFQGPDGRGEISGVSLGGTSRRVGAEDGLGVGGGTFTVNRMAFTSGGQRVGLSNLKVTSESRLNGPEHYDALAQYDLGELTLAGTNLRNVQLHLGLRHLARAPLGRLAALVGELRRQTRSASTGTGTPDLTEAQTRQLQDDLLALLRGNPQLTLDRLSLSQPGGDIVLQGQASLPGAAGLTGEQLQMLAQMPQMLAGMLDVSLKARANENALRDLLTLFGGKAGNLNGTVQGLIDAGYVRRSGQELSAEFRLREGQPTLNGQALGQ